MVTTEQIKTLRERTGVSVMQCKKALEEAGGNEEKALLLLKKKGAETAAKKADRALGAGSIAAYIHAGSKVGAMVELAAETDFVSGNPEFKQLAYDIAMHVAASSPEYLKIENVPNEAKEIAKDVFAKEVEGKPAALKDKILSGKLESYFAARVLLDQPFIKNPDTTIREFVESAIQKFGEKIEIVRFVRFEEGK
ncbi:MAG TPA: elongation factor Ts [Candidatus Magasanikbacteria bacterium]|nr:elongation factor Ts [Candidatus Magasanikbacteria bacterium]